MAQTAEGNGRLHDPTLRELTAELDGLRALVEAKLEALKTFVDERHDRYRERDESRSKAVEAAFSASKEAITKAEEGQRQYNATHNDLVRKQEAMIPRPEADARFNALETKLQEVKETVSEVRDEVMKEVRGLRESRSEGGGEKAGRVSQQQLLVMIVSLLFGLIGATAMIINALKR